MAVDAKELDRLLDLMITRNLGIEENERYVRGLNPYILGQPVAKTPDNRIPDPLAKMAVETIVGYAGRSGDKKATIELVSKEEAKEDKFIEFVRVSDAFNKVDLENAELYEESNIQGESYELWWVSNEMEFTNGLMTPEYKIVPNHEIIVIRTKDLKSVIEVAVHFTKDFEGTMTATAYYPKFKDTFIRKKGTTSWVKQKKVIYPYEIVPLNVFKSNRRSEPLFQAEKPLIDANDTILSKSLNEVDRFNAVILLLSKAVDQGFTERMKKGDISIIDELEGTGTGEKALAEYLEKNLQGAKDFYESLGKTLRMEFHKSTKIPDFWSETFTGGEQAAKALMVKLADLEFKASNIDMYFDQGIDRRLQFYADVWNASSNTPIDVNDYKVVIKSKRNVPVDAKDLVEIFMMLQGVSLKTRLSVLPKFIIDDVENELVRIKEELPSGTVPFDETVIEGEVAAVATEAVKLSGIQIKAANDIITLVGLPLDAGGITREAGINQLKIFLGLSDTQAALVMGNKQTGPAKSKASD